MPLMEEWICSAGEVEETTRKLYCIICLALLIPCKTSYYIPCSSWKRLRYLHPMNISISKSAYKIQYMSYFSCKSLLNSLKQYHCCWSNRVVFRAEDHTYDHTSYFASRRLIIIQHSRQRQRQEIGKALETSQLSLGSRIVAGEGSIGRDVRTRGQEKSMPSQAQKRLI